MITPKKKSALILVLHHPLTPHCGVIATLLLSWAGYASPYIALLFALGGIVGWFDEK